MMKELGINSGKVKKIISNFHIKGKHLLHAAAWRETEKKYTGFQDLNNHNGSNHTLCEIYIKCQNQLY